MKRFLMPVATLVVASLFVEFPAGVARAAAQPAPRDASASLTHVEGPHVVDGGDEWVIHWARGARVRVDRVPKSEEADVPAWHEAKAVAAELLVPGEPGPAVHAMPERILAAGDVHGRFASFRRVLQSSGVIDASGAWAFGTDHLVCCGDLMDREHDVVALLWFLRRLEAEAAEAGGAVHVILGNHEQLALQGDERYVHPELLAASARLGIRYADLFGRGTVLGDWLRTKHAIVRIGDIAFVHGGISARLLDLAAEEALDVDGVNAMVRDNLGVSREVRRANPVLEGLFGTTGPLWHRGYFRSEPEYDPTSGAELDRVLAWLDARMIVVGHTEFRRVGSHMAGRVIACDVNLDRTPEAVLISGGALLRVGVGLEPAPITPLQLAADDS